MMVSAREYSLPVKIEKQAWFADSGASHHLTLDAHFMHTKKPYAGHSRVCCKWLVLSH